MHRCQLDQQRFLAGGLRCLVECFEEIAQRDRGLVLVEHFVAIRLRRAYLLFAVHLLLCGDLHV